LCAIFSTPCILPKEIRTGFHGVFPSHFERKFDTCTFCRPHVDGSLGRQLLRVPPEGVAAVEQGGQRGAPDVRRRHAGRPAAHALHLEGRPRLLRRAEIRPARAQDGPSGMFLGRSARSRRQDAQERHVRQVHGSGEEDNEHVPRVVRQVVHEAGTGSVPIHGRFGSEGAQELGEVLHTQTGSDRVVLLHVQVDQGPEVQGLGLGGGASVGEAMQGARGVHGIEECVLGGSAEGRRAAELLPGGNA
jgi:hypothetical protein